MTEQQLIEIGFKPEESYNDDEFNTNRFSKGVLEVEITYWRGKLLTSELTIKELNCMPISFNQAKLLTEIIGHLSE